MNPSEPNAFLTTRAGVRFPVRPARLDDGATIKEFFSHVSRADLRFRFLSGMREVSPSQISMLTHPDHKFSESFLVFAADGETMLATGMLACDAAFDHGEVAIAIREDHKHEGIGWELLAHIARIAETKGLKTLESIESRENHDAIELERDMGFVAREYPGDSTLMLLSRSTDRH
jgi:N-acetylglutamate synthase-like GNAT family acetyltransferase